MFTYKAPVLPDVVVNNQTDIEGVSGVYKSSEIPIQNNSSENNFGEFLSKKSKKIFAPASVQKKGSDLLIKSLSESS